MNLYEYAIKMEIDGEKYYRDQAAKNEGHPISRVFLILAKAEEKHADLLRRRKDLTAETVLPDQEAEKNIFNAMADFKADVTSIPRQLDVYRLALEVEQKSIELYKKMLAEADNEQDKKLLRFLVEQETDHYNLFDSLLTLVERPEEWVEDAEFGHREDY